MLRCKSQESARKYQTKKPDPFGRDRASLYGVAVTYFRVRMHTIIGADPFHGSVRDGKTWFQIAIAATWTGCRSGSDKMPRQIRGRNKAIWEEIAPSAKH
jgi:hypothetical protein